MGRDKSATKWLQINNNANIKTWWNGFLNLQDPESRITYSSWGMESKIKPQQYVEFVEGEGIEEPFRGLSFSASHIGTLWNHSLLYPPHYFVIVLHTLILNNCS